MRGATPQPSATTEMLEGHDAPETLFSPLPPAAVIGGRYEILELLGRGGYATVYRARDRELKRDIALKILRPERVTASTMSRLRREVNIAREALSAHLVRVFDLGADGETVFLTMELIEGESLRQRLNRHGRLEIAAAVDVAVQMLRGLEALHAKKAIHRDVKPENVMIAADGTVKLGDFGLVRGLDGEESHATMIGGFVGTADYVSPEQALGLPADERTDLYATGVLLFEMLTGELPFVRHSSLGSILARVRMRARAVRSLRRDVPYWLAGVIARLLERRPARRYRTAREVAAALAAHRIALRSWLPRARTIIVAAVLIVAVIVGIRLKTSHRQTRFVRLDQHGEQGIVAIGRDGETLWRRDDVDFEIAKNRWALVRVRRNEPPLLATVLAPRGEFHLEKVLTLSFLSPDTGRVVKQVSLPDGAVDVNLASRRYWPCKFTSIDIDGDGVDELLITYIHLPEAPSFTILYEPLLDRSRVLYQAVGHYLFAGLRDVDGDGRPDVLLLGINNAFDWINALTAVRITPWISDPAPANDVITRSPDLAERPPDEANTLWHALLPRFSYPGTVQPLLANAKDRNIIVNVPERYVAVTPEGFLAGERSALAPRQRNAFRNAAYAGYREANRLFDLGATEDALHEVAGAVRNARNAQESILVELMRRTQASMLIRSGHGAEGHAVAEDLRRDSENRSEIAYEAAVAHHLHGDLRLAAAWYERGMESGGSQIGGKSKHEFIQGIVLALCELKDWDGAVAAIGRYRRAYVRINKAVPDWTHVYDEFVRWRRGERPRLEDVYLFWYSVDIARYWALEFRLNRGDAVADLLPAVEAELAVGAQPQSIWHGLHAELLNRAGRRSEAAAEAARAKERLDLEIGKSIVARGHAEIIRQRYARIAGARG